MSGIRPRSLLVVAIGIAVVAVGGVYGVRRSEVARARGRWEARLAELRAAGEPTVAADLTGDPVPEAENAESLLRRVRESYDDNPLWKGGITPTLMPIEDPDGDWSEGERAQIEAWWSELEPLFASLEEASRRPVLVSTASDPLGHEFIPSIQRAGSLWRLEADFRPNAAANLALQNLRVAVAWRPRNDVETFVRWWHFHGSVRLLHRAYDLGLVGSADARGALRVLLRQAEAGVWEDRARILRVHRVRLIAYVAWCTGDGPRPTDVLADAETIVEDTRRHRRRGVYEDALAELDRIEHQLRDIRSEADLRASAERSVSVHPGVRSVHNQRGALLRSLAVLRLGRWALVLEEEIAAGRSLPDELEALAERFPDGPPLDPFTGRAFRWEAQAGGRFLAVDVSASDEQHTKLSWFFDVPLGDDEDLVEADLGWRFQAR